MSPFRGCCNWLLCKTKQDESLDLKGPVTSVVQNYDSRFWLLSGLFYRRQSLQYKCCITAKAAWFLFFYIFILQTGAVMHFKDIMTRPNFGADKFTSSRWPSPPLPLGNHSEHLFKRSAVEHSFQDWMNTYCHSPNAVLLTFQILQFILSLLLWLLHVHGLRNLLRQSDLR